MILIDYVCGYERDARTSGGLGHLLSSKSIKHLENNFSKAQKQLAVYEKRLTDLSKRKSPNHRLIKQQQELINKTKNEMKANSEVLNAIKGGSGSASKTVSNKVQDEVKDRKKNK